MKGDRQMVKTGVAFPPAMLARIKRDAAINEITVGAFLRRATTFWFEHSILAARQEELATQEGGGGQ